MVDLLPQLAVAGVVGVVVGEHAQRFGVEHWSESALPDLVVLFLFYQLHLLHLVPLDL